MEKLNRIVNIIERVLIVWIAVFSLVGYIKVYQYRVQGIIDDPNILGKAPLIFGFISAFLCVFFSGTPLKKIPVKSVIYSFGGGMQCYGYFVLYPWITDLGEGLYMWCIIPAVMAAPCVIFRIVQWGIALYREVIKQSGGTKENENCEK